MVYQWREGARFSIPANVAGREIAKIQKRDGKVETEAVVTAAEPEDAPLHPAFEWRDDVAAHEYRLTQARSLVRSIVVVEEESRETTPAYVHVKAVPTEPGYYQSVTVAVRNVDEWTRAIDEMARQTNAMIRSLEALQRMAQGKDQKTVRRVKSAVAAAGKVRAAVEKITA